MASKSGIIGVYWRKKEGKWCSEISIKSRTYCLGFYSTIAEAQIARKQAEERITSGTFFNWYKEKINQPKYKDLTGQRFGRLTVLRHEFKDGKHYWICRCDCGNETTVYKKTLSNGDVRSCGCLDREARQARAIDLSGQKFGSLLALEKNEKASRPGMLMWKCQCDCGNTIDVITSELTNGLRKSCGCQRYAQFVEGTYVATIRNDKLSKNNTSGVRGVCWHTQKEKWAARINFKGKRYHLGCFDDINEAAQARKCAEEQMFKPFLEWYEKYEESLFHRESGNHKSGVVGVIWHDRKGKWHSSIRANKKNYSLGYHATIEDACIAKEQAEKRIADGTFFDWYREKISQWRTDVHSGVVGVSWNERDGKWCAHIMIQHKNYSIGYYTTIADARAARVQAEERVAQGTFLDWYKDKKNRPKYKDLTGQRFGRLTAMRHELIENKHCWICQCDCGKETIVGHKNLKTGNTKSCGCLKREYIEEQCAKNFIDGTCLPWLIKQKLRKDNTSGIRGVCWLKHNQKWEASIGFKGKKYKLGYFDNIDDAVIARKRAEAEFHEPFLKWYEEYSKSSLISNPSDE